MRILTILLFFQIPFCVNTYGQVDSSSSLKPIIQDFFKSKSVVDFMQPKADTIVNMIDVNNSLFNFEIAKWDDKKLNIITEGKAVEEVKKYSFLSYYSKKENLYIFTFNQNDCITYYRIFCPFNGRDCHIAVEYKNNKFIVIKRSRGWF